MTTGSPSNGVHVMSVSCALFPSVSAFDGIGLSASARYLLRRAISDPEKQKGGGIVNAGQGPHPTGLPADQTSHQEISCPVSFRRSRTGGGLDRRRGGPTTAASCAFRASISAASSMVP